MEPTEDQRPEDVFVDGLMETKAPVATEPPASVALPRSITSRSVFSHPEAHPVALDLVLLKNFDLEWLRWLPDTLFSEIEKTFGTSIAEVNRIKILAAQTLHTIDSFWEAWEIFEKVVWSLNGHVPRVDVLQPPDLSILMSGVDMANGIRQETYGEEVARYCAAVFLYENVLYAPEPLSFCQKYIDNPMYECHDCGKMGSALPPFSGMCWSCGEFFDSEHPFKFAPDPEAVKKGRGRNITIANSYDSEPVKKRFQELNALPSDRLQSSIRETAEDIQAAKLIIATDFTKHRSQQLADQLTSLRGWLETS
jgi:hypothetical protein